MSHPRSRLRTLGALALKLAIGLGLLALVVYLNREDVEKVLSGRLRAGAFATAFTLYFAGLLLAFVRWFVLVRAADLPIRLRSAIRLGFIGNLFNLVIPGAIGGDLVKGAYFLHEQPGRKARAAASIALDRLIGLLGLFLLALGVGAAGWGRLDPAMRRLVLVVAGITLAVVFVLAVAFSPAIFHALHDRLKGRRRLGKLLNEFAIMGTAYRSRPGALIVALLLACVTHALNVVSFRFVSAAMFDQIPTLASHFLIVPLILFSTAIPLPFGALGVAEGISLTLFRLVDYEGGLVAMMGFRLLQYIGCLPSLIVYLANRREVARLTGETSPERAVKFGPVASP